MPVASSLPAPAGLSPFSSPLFSSRRAFSGLSAALLSSAWRLCPAHKPVGPAASSAWTAPFSPFSSCVFAPFRLGTENVDRQPQLWAVPKKRVSHSRTRTRRSVWMKRKPKKQYAYSSIDTFEALQQTEGTLTAGRTLHANWLSLPGGVYLHRLKYSVRGSGHSPGMASLGTEHLDFQNDLEQRKTQQNL
ncbi:hypothetical protein TGRH88_031920 [Toxoplasma gondii]|uniref:Uncharacterized protein n=1 Tax=Toxoplasma gondii TaxID=5811 RepID=A0A7J6KAH5_TOXGO|nr:hypothetical protein TGRH88_031920 [Toxoplasma gondii]